jgi:anaphase-promoting complex subunit 4
MAGDLHVETVAYTDGRVRVYLTDLRRADVAPAGVEGSVTLSLAGGRVVVPLTPSDGHLEAHTREIPAGELAVEVRLVRAGRPIELHLVVPVGIPPGLAGLPRACQPPVDRAPDGVIGPRCVVDFPRMVRVLAVARDPTTLLVAVFGHGVTLWRLPDAQATGALDPAPGGDAHPEHVHPVDALAVRPDGREVAVAVERAILRYGLPGGTIVRELPRDHHLVRALAYAPGGRRLLVSTLVDGTAELLDADAGTEIARFRVDRPLSAATFAADGDRIVLASETGPITVRTAGGNADERVLPAATPARALAVAGDRLVTGADDGAVVIWDLRTGRAVAETRSGPGILVFAMQADGRVVAAGRQDGTVTLHDLDSGAVVGRLAAHSAAVQALAWVGNELASGDARGRLALWDLSAVVESLYKRDRGGLRSAPDAR